MKGRRSKTFGRVADFYLLPPHRLKNDNSVHFVTFLLSQILQKCFNLLKPLPLRRRRSNGAIVSVVECADQRSIEGDRTSSTLPLVSMVKNITVRPPMIPNTAKTK